MEKANLTHTEYLCVEFDVCTTINHRKVYIPETGGPGIEGVEYMQDGAHCVLSKNKGYKM